MNYAELQAKAKELGLPYTAVSRKNLEKSIAKATTSVEPAVTVEEMGVTKTYTEVPKEKKSKSQSKAVKVEIRDEPTKPVVEEPKEIEVPEDANTASIYEGNYRIRVYSKEQHGDDFGELAKIFIKRDPLKLKIVFETKNSILKCPNCGSKINCSNCGKDIS